MWSLQDATSLPSERERTIATETINTLRKKKVETLAKAEELKQEAKKLEQEANKLEHEILKINTWLAPIRRVPIDVLSLIFIEICRVDWAAPRQLGLVCRLWRAALLDTPRAWAFLQVEPDSRKIYSGTLLSLWISRSGAFKHHISLPPSTSEKVMDAVCFNGANIKCLSFFEYSSRLQKLFPYLEELRLGPQDLTWADRVRSRNARNLYPPLRTKEDEGKENPSSILSIKRFPKLVTLHVHSPHPMAMEAIAHKDCFPALRELHIHVCGPHWLNIIRCCAQTLITLAIEYIIDYDDKRSREEINAEVDLPQLQHLHYIFKDMDPDRDLFLPLIKTPNIQSYHQYIGDTSTVHPQASLATSVFLNSLDTANLSEFLCVTHLQIYDTPGNIEGLLMNLDEEGVCPKLASIKCISSSAEDCRHMKYAEARARMLLKEAGRSIELQYIHAETDKSYMGYSQCYTYCRCELPAEVGQQDHYQEESYHVDSEEDDDEEGSEADDDYDGYDDYDEYEHRRWSYPRLWY